VTIPSVPDSRPSLVIDASTYRGTVAVVTDNRVLADEVVAMREARTEELMPAVVRALRRSGVDVAGLRAVICGSGPGSFTSLRLAAAIGKGLTGAHVMTSPRPLASVSSLALIVAGAADRLGQGVYLATLDALRGERYAALMQVAGSAGGEGRDSVSVRPRGTWRRLGEADLRQWAQEADAPLVGPGCAIDAWPQAAGVVRLWSDVVAVDPVSWEPEYGRLAEAEVRRATAKAGPAR
jgi:tRNA threonylcarbamoyladenosine biosynthesis protein TsaB